MPASYRSQSPAVPGRRRGQPWPSARPIPKRKAALRDQLTADFGLTEAEVVAFRERIAAQVQRIHDIEADAIQQLKAAMA
ncbi:MAG: hypothetical protein H6651_04290 [Ardenticatenales bacterium]|nr:hypothetical protein [Ardenticatenales bacterium]